MNKKLFLVFALLFVIFLMLIYTTPLTKRLEFDSSTEARLKTWKNSGVIIKENPLIGVGIGSYQRSYQNITGEKLKGEHAHNQFLHIFAERGIVTGLLFIYIMVLLFISNWKLIKNSKRLLKYLALGLFAGFIAFFTQGMFEYLFFYSRNALFFWFLAALAIYLEDEDVKKID